MHKFELDIHIYNTFGIRYIYIFDNYLILLKLTLPLISVNEYKLISLHLATQRDG